MQAALVGHNAAWTRMWQRPVAPIFNAPAANPLQSEELMRPKPGDPNYVRPVAKRGRPVAPVAPVGQAG